MTYEMITSYGCGNEQALHIMKEVDEYDFPVSEPISFDFKKFGEITPFNVLTIASYLKSYRSKHPGYQFYLSPKSEENDFLSHLGFYQMIGANVGKAVGEARASLSYVPIKKIDLGEDFYDSIDLRANELAALLSFDKSLETFISYVFVETIRNVYEHSETDAAFICAQKWPTKNLVEIAIVDTGVGVAKALLPRFPNRTEKELLYLSAEPGISAQSNHRVLGKHNMWSNSGYGLYALRKLAILYEGSFLLCSGRHALWQQQSGVTEYETAFPGTAIAIRIRTDTNNNFDDLRRQVIREGQAEAKGNAGAIKRASKSSGGDYRR